MFLFQSVLVVYSWWVKVENSRFSEITFSSQNIIRATRNQMVSLTQTPMKHKMFSKIAMKTNTLKNKEKNY